MRNAEQGHPRFMEIVNTETGRPMFHLLSRAGSITRLLSPSAFQAITSPKSLSRHPAGARAGLPKDFLLCVAETRLNLGIFYSKRRAAYFILDVTSKGSPSNLKCYVSGSRFYCKSVFGACM